MQIVPVTRNELALDTDDWKRLKTLMNDFDYVCGSQSCCDSCPLGKFCNEHESPVAYLKDLHDFLDDYPKDKE
jgi:hypothetical protein